jgi:hypothetical protein
MAHKPRKPQSQLLLLQKLQISGMYQVFKLINTVPAMIDIIRPLTCTLAVATETLYTPWYVYLPPPCVNWLHVILKTVVCGHHTTTTKTPGTCTYEMWTSAAVYIKTTVFWETMSYNLVDRYIFSHSSNISFLKLKTTFIFKTPQICIPEDHNCNIHHDGKLKSYVWMNLSDSVCVRLNWACPRWSFL